MRRLVSPNCFVSLQDFFWDCNNRPSAAPDNLFAYSLNQASQVVWMEDATPIADGRDSSTGIGSNEVTEEFQRHQDLRDTDGQSLERQHRGS